MTETIPTAADYDAALHGVALAEEHNAGRILMRGRDRAALLHRLSTNDILRLQPGHGTRTVLTTPTNGGMDRTIDVRSLVAGHYTVILRSGTTYFRSALLRL